MRYIAEWLYVQTSAAYLPTAKGRFLARVASSVTAQIGGSEMYDNDDSIVPFVILTIFAIGVGMMIVGYLLTILT